MEPLAIFLFILFWMISAIAGARGGRTRAPRRAPGGWPEFPPPEREPPAEPATPVAPAAPAESAVTPPQPAATTQWRVLQEPVETGPAGAADEGAGAGRRREIAGPPLTHAGFLQPESVLAGIVLSEVLGPPKARRPLSSRRWR